MTTYMLDTCICSYIMREHPASVLQRLTYEVEQGDRIVISAITYAEMRYGQIGKKASAKHKVLIDEFVERVDAVLSWDQRAVDATVTAMSQLRKAGTPIGPNDTAIAGHAIATGCTLVTNNVREFSRVPSLVYEDWV
ncbi:MULTISPECIES: type II toxin-antitoxin system VapC family toxin [unclassified Marinobacter]|uniref:type II toxin-antitoxin system VapC family toxin n=1 Tax=unclassified Marinobacter TaxID=83889 RepID=UPI00200F4BF7|nr:MULTISPECIES: type II toxin-antitoxin system VapC family toxin [unclassified Marinobacter]MCL1484766.1 type II toxin-antitoxin system VapC family toxin [Marinobacter sp.]UQG56567.1 type II toxin-antitoxin system VapC family toxin [Marinobacter sp. M4C]UQG65371.1 type II toxin-antitoxin system VapC family toxin [Marinobacter sp. M2C]UQG69650.1 type II toxin-antitoxin system VapC family toxin [Marinobacter sp. M1C]